MHTDKALSSQLMADALMVKPVTLEQCHEVNEALSALNKQLVQRVAAQEEQMLLLQEKVKLSSRNSSKPPSSDGPGRPNRAQRRASARKRGAQKGHPGAYRRLLPEAEQSGCSRTAKTCANLLKLWQAMWTFVNRAEVEPTNNAAEQALRSIVLKRKISGPTRSRRGDEFIARGFSAMESCRRQGRDLLNYLHHSVRAWIDQTTPPSRVPTG